MINAYMTDTVLIKRAKRDEWGTPSEKTISVRGRIEQKTRLVRNLAGEQVASSARVWLPITDTVFLDNDDRIYFDGRTYAILALERVKAFSALYVRADLG